MPDVNPTILGWARETAGLSLEEAAKALGIGDARGQTGAERLAELEQGKRSPTRSQLTKMAQRYRRSLLVFYLEAPPRSGDRGQDFRRLPDAPPISFNPNLDALLRDVRTRQTLVRALLDDDDVRALDFVGSARISQSKDSVRERIVEKLAFDRDVYRHSNSAEASFAYLRERIESLGVFVVLLGNLGSHHSNIPVEMFRGFALADPIAPFIVINDQDAKAAWAFTALHELVHLWLGLTGVSGARAETQVEQFCNKIASEILLPERELDSLSAPARGSFEALLDSVSMFAEQRKISRAMVAFRLFQAGTISQSQWSRLDGRIRQDWLDVRERRRTRESEGGPNFFVVRRHRLGKQLLSLVSRALSDGDISPSKAGRILGVRPRKVAPLLAGVDPRGGV